ncbi:UNVERIFIED_CONTAM: hypothetical protein Sindi_0514400 [Sesamum indicum]
MRWIEECITTPSFSVGLNGKAHDFFVGSRGLRKGDPLSPYLFFLVMEVMHLVFLQIIEQDGRFQFHWKCESSNIFQLSFADDVILFSRVAVDTIRVFKDRLDRFGDWSGLWLNAQKSHLILSQAAQGMKEELLTILELQEGQLPMRYLRLPSISSRLSISDCLPLLNKIKSCIAGWEGLALTYAGRVQIIKFVLSSLSTGSSGYAKVAWRKVCKPKDEGGGQGLKDIGTMNRVLMCKKLCDVIRCDRTSIWMEWLHQGRLLDSPIWTISENKGSWHWKKFIRLRAWLRSEVVYRIGNGWDFYLWRDPWHHLGPLIQRVLHGPIVTGLQESTRLRAIIHEGQWQWPCITDFECLEILQVLPIIYGGNDRILWRFSGNIVTIQEKLATIDKQLLSHLGGCVLCTEDNSETQTHLFFHCQYSRCCLTIIRQTIRFLWPNRQWQMDIEWASRKWRGKHIINMAYCALLGACICHIWRERNMRRFEHTSRSPATLASLIIEDVRLRIISKNLPSSVSSSALYTLWRIPWPIEGNIQALLYYTSFSRL